MKSRRLIAVERTAALFHKPRTAWLVLCAGLLLTFAAWFYSNRVMHEIAEQRITVRSGEITRAIEGRLNVYEGLLWGGAAFFRASGHVDRAMWREFVEQLDLEHSWPGIQGLGFSVPVSPAELERHIQGIRDEGYPDYTIRPEGVRDSYSAIIYLEPFDWRNQRAFGYDMRSNETRRAAMIHARDEGKTATSGVVTLVQETDQDIQKGFLTYVPLYRQGVPLDTVEARRAAFRGWVYAPFRMGDLMHGIVDESDKSVIYEIFSGADIDEEHLLFDSDGQFAGRSFRDRSRFVKSTKLELHGQTWTINFSSGTNSLIAAEQMVPAAIGATGLVVDLLLFYILMSVALVNRRIRSKELIITKKLNAEQEKVAEEKRRAEESNIRLRNAINALQDGFAMYGPDDRLIVANSRYRDFYGSLVDLIEPGVTFETLIREGVRRGQWPEAIGQEEIWIAERMRRHRKGGEVFEQAIGEGRWLQIAEYKTDDGNTVGIRVDITDLKNAQTEANQARLDAEAASQAKSRFLSMMSHEIRTPLNGVLGVHRLLESEDLPTDVKLKLQAARESGEFLLALVNQVLDFSRIEAGSVQGKDKTFSVDSLLDILSSMFKPQIDENGLRFKYRIVGDGRAPLYGDYDHIRQVLFNLVGNAIKFTRVGGVEIVASIDESSPDSIQLGFAVKDTGLGIAADDQEKIFEEFYQTEIGQLAGGGTGLGLTIAQRLVESMGGRLTVQSKVGEGTVFRFSVPVGRSDSLDNLVHGDVDGDGIRSLHALVVEDNEINQMITCEILKRDGHTSEVAVDGLVAIEMLSEKADRFDLVLMDIHMPRMDGLQATRAIRAMGLDSDNLPIIALTANAFEDQKREYLDAGMQGVLTKPVEIAAVRKALARVAAALNDRGGEVLAVGATAEPDQQPDRGDHPVQLVDQDLFLATREMLGQEQWPTTWRKFQAECGRLIGELDDADIGDTEIADVAHNLKGMSANLGFAGLSAECAEIVTDARKKTDTRQIRAGLRDTFERSLVQAEGLGPLPSDAVQQRSAGSKRG